MRQTSLQELRNIGIPYLSLNSAGGDYGLESALVGLTASAEVRLGLPLGLQTWVSWEEEGGVGSCMGPCSHHCGSWGWGWQLSCLTEP